MERWRLLMSRTTGPRCSVPRDRRTRPSAYATVPGADSENITVGTG
ncbi:hypothetical protein [Streptomyces sp. NPDC055681]